MARSVFRYRVAALAAMMALASPLQAYHPASPTDSAASLSASAQSAAAVVDAFHAALKRGDASAAASLLAADALIFEEGGAERSKDEYAQHHLPADAAFVQAVPSTITRRSGAVAGNLAWIATESRTMGIYQGKTIDRLTTESMVLRKVGGRWQIVHIHWSSGAAS